MSLSPPSALEAVVLSSGASRAYVAPSRGGILTRLFVDGRPVLYLDEATLLDPTKNVRGGVPVLFPSPGRLAGDRFATRGKTGAMGQHGVARGLPWEVARRTESEVELRLSSTDATLAAYPWRFVLTYRYRLRGAGVRIEQRFETEDDEMPFSAGFHPYFQVPTADKARARIVTPATRAFDNVTKREIDLTGPIDLTAKEVDLHLVDHGSSEAVLELGDGYRVEVKASSAFSRWVVWTLEGRDFVCLEPWTAPANALNTGADLLVARRDEPVDLFCDIALLPARQ
jgi:galactose mutarotase-like enzyme